MMRHLLPTAHSLRVVPREPFIVLSRRSPAVLGALLVTLLPLHCARAESFGDKLARCIVQERSKPGYNEAPAMAYCERVAQAGRDQEL